MLEVDVDFEFCFLFGPILLLSFAADFLVSEIPSFLVVGDILWAVRDVRSLWLVCLCV